MNIERILDGSERWRCTISMNKHGIPSFSVIGLHTRYEVIGVLFGIISKIAGDQWNQRSPDIAAEITRSKS